MKCRSFCVANAYDMTAMLDTLQKKELAPVLYDDAIYVSWPSASTEEKHQDGGCAFFFEYGCSVIWGLSDEEARTFLESMNVHANFPFAVPFEDACSYISGNVTDIHEENDVIVLESDDPLIKLSLSHGLSQSVKLKQFESSVLETIAKNRHLPQELAKKGKISLSRRKLAKQVGALFEERTSINLHKDIMDTPEFFWRRPKFEAYYTMSVTYMDLDQRLDVLNKRLDFIHELYGILSDEVNHIHSSRLELIIIYLIVIEVVLVIIKDFLQLL